MEKDKIQYKTFNIKEPDVDMKERTFQATITRTSLDLDNEVVLARGLNIKDFKNNGIILAYHDGTFPVGTTTDIKRVGEEFRIKARFASEAASERINEVYQLVKEGILRTMSIGMLVTETRAPTAQDIKEYSKDVRRIISKAKLLEASFVTIPSNQGAVVTGCKSLELDPKHFIEDYQETIEEETKEIIEEEIKEETAQGVLIKRIKEELKIEEESKELVSVIKVEMLKHNLLKNGKIYW